MPLDWNKVTDDDLTTPLLELRDELGMDTVRALIERFGGAHFYVPTAAAIERRQVEEAIRADLAAGVPPGRVRTRHRVSARTVERIAAAVRREAVASAG